MSLPPLLLLLVRWLHVLLYIQSESASEVAAAALSVSQSVLSDFTSISCIHNIDFAVAVPVASKKERYLTILS